MEIADECRLCYDSSIDFIIIVRISVLCVLLATLLYGWYTNTWSAATKTCVGALSQCSNIPHAHIHTHAHTHIHTRMDTQTHARMDTQMHTHTHTHTHTRTHTLLSVTSVHTQSIHSAHSLCLNRSNFLVTSIIPPKHTKTCINNIHSVHRQLYNILSKKIHIKFLIVVVSCCYMYDRPHVCVYIYVRSFEILQKYSH